MGYRNFENLDLGYPISEAKQFVICLIMVILSLYFMTSRQIIVIELGTIQDIEPNFPKRFSGIFSKGYQNLSTPIPNE